MAAVSIPSRRRVVALSPSIASSNGRFCFVRNTLAAQSCNEGASPVCAPARCMRIECSLNPKIGAALLYSSLIGHDTNNDNPFAAGSDEPTI